ncbi:hypothetical protein THOM_0929 [Trachipleistophora hominis]|uniref:Uncharacterized protein n=1 Tax=Trachipleistophora hominis TaxID=72359 RepID=L7JXD6_TRAHO|nr:hypothetical protein THOM_0929 [Trachipleistophora hominis]
MNKKYKISLTAAIVCISIISVVLLCFYHLKHANKKFISLIQSNLIKKNTIELFGAAPYNTSIIMLSKVTLAQTDVLVISPSQRTLTNKYVVPLINYKGEKLAAYTIIINALSSLWMGFEHYRRCIALVKANVGVLDNENLFARVGSLLFWTYDIVLFDKFLSFFAKNIDTADLFCYFFKISNGKLSIIRMEIAGTKAVKKTCAKYYLGKYAENMLAYFVEMQSREMTENEVQTVLRA